MSTHFQLCNCCGLIYTDSTFDKSERKQIKGVKSHDLGKQFMVQLCEINRSGNIDN